MLKNFAKLGQKLRPVSRTFSAGDNITINIDGKDHEVKFSLDKSEIQKIADLEFLKISDF